MALRLTGDDTQIHLLKDTLPPAMTSWEKAYSDSMGSFCVIAVVDDEVVLCNRQFIYSNICSMMSVL